MAPLDWDIHYVAGPIVRAHQHAAGAQKGLQPPKPEAGVKAASAPKVHLRAEGKGQLVTLLLTPGPQHEATVLWALMDQGVRQRARGGHPKERGCYGPGCQLIPP